MSRTIRTIAIDRILCNLMIGKKSAYTAALSKYAGTLGIRKDTEVILFACTYGHEIPIRNAKFSGKAIVYVKLVFH